MDTIPLSFPILLDGATGTELQRRGMPMGACTEQWVLDHPEALVELQRGYVAAGCQILTAPTFGANRLNLARHGVDAGLVADYNRRLLALSREAAGGKALVAADLSPLGQFIRPFGEATFEELVEVYTEQARALTDADLFLLETFTTMFEARAAVLAVRSVSDKPVFVTFTCDENGRTMSGTDVLAALIVMEGMGVSAFGLNCSTGPDVMAAQLERLGEHATVPLIAKPNAGLPTLVDGAAHYNCPPDRFAAQVERMAAAGVRLFGGCCGTHDGHLAALKEALGRVDFGSFPVRERDPDVIPCASEREARFITPDVDTVDVACSPDILEDILDAEEEHPGGGLKIGVWSEDDLDCFAENQYAIKDALCLESDVPELLEKALRAYQGRAFWDGTGGLEPHELEPLTKKYGLIVL